MAQLTTTSDDRPSTRETAETSVPGFEITSPTRHQGADMWRVARDSGTLDLNTSYAYLLMARDFAGTSRVAVQDGEVVGFVLGYRRPTDPECLFIWQIAVDTSLRGRKVAAQLLDALVSDLSGVRTLETTITADNAASQRLFASFAERHGADHRIEPLFEESDFPDPGHGAELLHVIGELTPGS
ncbi:diaminobutyrate acetyltransferase [Brachybacterium sacelli]|uniref:L-2,4-diaminobutyric acid acetyltransferase n=1 Tax=Brachybacterium sacelli TaxID=173364 RepID=A0ABS4X3Q7_9MICO|nr:diaminobutyrate acetyltransferase [Brachybacterium sacelli]MBP2383076.1 L-2,4-diaminobutyric acid acetyltransferase [Brachybacterium sacelli]